jgi:hypothetical protein
LAALQDKAQQWLQICLELHDGTRPFIDVEQQFLAENPVDLEAIHKVEGECGEVAALYYRQCVVWKKLFNGSVDAYKVRAMLYFKTLKEQRRFKKLCGELSYHGGLDIIWRGFFKASDAYSALALHPPDFEWCASSLRGSWEALDNGTAGFGAARKSLLAML